MSKDVFVDHHENLAHSLSSRLDYDPCNQSKSMYKRNMICNTLMMRSHLQRLQFQCLQVFLQKAMMNFLWVNRNVSVRRQQCSMKIHVCKSVFLKYHTNCHQQSGTSMLQSKSSPFSLSPSHIIVHQQVKTHPFFNSLSLTHWQVPVYVTVKTRKWHLSPLHTISHHHLGLQGPGMETLWSTE